MATASSNALVLDPELEAQRRQAAQRLANFKQSDLLRRNNANMDTTNTLRQIDEETPSVYRRLLNNYTGRGLAYSSGYGYAYGDQANQIANSKSKANSALAALLAGYDQEAQAQNSDYQLTLDELLAEQAAKNAQNAGHNGTGAANSGGTSGSGGGAGGGTTGGITGGTPTTGTTGTVGKAIDPGFVIGLPKPSSPTAPAINKLITMPITQPTPTLSRQVSSPLNKLIPMNTGTGSKITVASGQTAQQIAAKYNLPISTLLSINGLTSISQIQPGMTLRVT